MTTRDYIMVAGGAGYIGSHMARLLLDSGYSVIVYDNLSTGHRDLVDKRAVFVSGDIRDYTLLDKVFKDYHVEAVMHFCAFIEVGESVTQPLKYYMNNVSNTLNLVAAMRNNKVNKLIFSSTAAVYGNPKVVPIEETAETIPVNPYGRSKLMIETVLADIAAADPSFSYAALRYFNACGAHPNGGIGEKHRPESHLIPNVLKAAKAGTAINMFGDDYPTEDGTCVRDYVHVVDLCLAHHLALEAFEKGVKNQAFNLGSGRGYSVKEIIEKAEAVTEKKIKVNISPRRPGDAAALVASSQKAKDLLGWVPKYALTDMIKTAWAWENSQSDTQRPKNKFL